MRLSFGPSEPALDGRIVGETVLASPYFFDFAPGTGAATVMSTFSDLGVPVDQGFAVLVQQNISRFQIAVQYAFTVRVLHSTTHFGN